MNVTNRPGTEVRCTDLETGDYEESTILNDYVIVTDGDRYVDNIVVHPGGTVVVTIRNGGQMGSKPGAAP